MTELDESLTILDFYGGRIKGKNNFLMSNISFDINTCIQEVNFL